MKKLRIILLFSLIIRIIYILSASPFNSLYDDKTEYIEGVIIDYKIKEDKIDMVVKGKEKLKVDYYIENTDFNYKLGDKVKLTCDLKRPNKNTNFYLFNYRNYLLSQKIYYVCNLKNIELIEENKSILYDIKNKIINHIESSDASDYLYLFILGKNNLDSDINASYRGNGISHLFAISGMHITLFTSILLFLFKKNRLKKILIFTFLIFYIFLTNYSVSVIRSSLLFILLNSNIKMKSDKILLIIVIILLTYNPFYIYNIGFLFSFIVSYTLIKFNITENLNNYFLKIFMISLEAFIVTTPIMINNFFEINLLTPFINILFVPLISFIIFPLSIIVFFIPSLSNVLLILINILETISLFINKIDLFKITLCHINMYIFISYYLIIIFILYKAKKHNYKFIVIYFIVIVLHTLYPYLKTDYSIHFIDVGQGDSSLISLPHNKNILIDTGGKYNSDLSKNILIPYLKANGIKQLDSLILTHGDFDHMGEAINLVENFKIKEVIFNCGLYNDLENELFKTLEKKNIEHYICIEELKLGNNKLYFLNTKEYDNENDNSSVIYTELNNYKFLFMGDASSVVEKEILNKYNLPDIDVLKVGHHGSRTSSSEEYIDIINPKYSLISVGRNNRYGHPNSEVLYTLKNSKVYRTDIDGSVVFKIKKNKLSIKRCLPYEGVI